MKIFFQLIVILFLFQHTGYAQKQNQERIDSLLTELTKAKEDTTKLSLLGDIMYAHVYYKPQEGLNYQKAGIELAQKINWPIGTAKIKDKIGRLNWRLGNFSEALKYHTEAFNIYEKAFHNYKNYVLVEIAQDYLDDGKLTEAESYLLKSLKLSEGIGDKKTMVKAYDILVYLYNIQGNTDEMTKMMYTYLKVSEELGDKQSMIHAAYTSAIYFQSMGNNMEGLKYFKLGLKAATETGDKLAESHFNSYIGGLYNNLGNFTEAQHHYAAALRLAGESGDAKMLAGAYRDMGNFYQSENNFTEAINHYRIASAKYKSITDKEGLAIIYYKMAITYTSAKKYEQATKSFDSSKAYYDNLNSKLLSMGDYYAGRENLAAATRNWKDAYENYKQFVIIKDSAFNKESLQKLVSSQMQYEVDKKETAAKAEQEKKDVVTQAEIKWQRNIKNATFSLLAVVLLFSGVVFRQRNKIAKEKKRSDLLLLDKELLLKEIHHRVKNNLEVVSSLLALQSAQIDDPNTKEAMLAGQNRVHSIGIVHQKLYQGTNLGAIEMKDYFINLSESILDSFGAEGKVNIEFAMEKLNLDIDMAVPLGLIVNELLTNTLKYAFPDKQNGSVRIKLEKRTNNILHLEVSDNGVGKSGENKGTGFGGQLISLLTSQLNGKMTEDQQNGTSVFFDFKLEKVA